MKKSNDPTDLYFRYYRLCRRHGLNPSFNEPWICVHNGRTLVGVKKPFRYTTKFKLVKRTKKELEESRCKAYKYMFP